MAATKISTHAVFNRVHKKIQMMVKDVNNISNAYEN